MRPPELDASVRDGIAASRLGSLPPELLREVLAAARHVRIPARSTIRPVAGRSPHLELVLAGLVRIQVTSPDGRAITIRYCRRGALMGAATLYTDVVRPFTIEALSDTELLRFEPSTITRLAAQDPRLAAMLLAETSERVMAFVDEFSGHAFRTVPQRVARHLLDLASIEPQAPHLTASVSQQELADAVGTVREVVVRVLRSLREQGCVRTERGGIVLTDPERLSAIAAGEP